MVSSTRTPFRAGCELRALIGRTRPFLPCDSQIVGVATTHTKKSSSNHETERPSTCSDPSLVLAVPDFPCKRVGHCSAAHNADVDVWRPPETK